MYRAFILSQMPILSIAILLGVGWWEGYRREVAASPWPAWLPLLLLLALFLGVQLWRWVNVLYPEYIPHPFRKGS
ncbi:MAG: hypothetical protein D6812_00960 [Deltaproteobacteria bacterium]|nr:MAG: hypothetical protein D6812_00960 [Deltaproteobacteria bacterium]